MPLFGRTVTVRAPINIALIKYWGKSDDLQVLPSNDSISITLDMAEVYSETAISLLPGQEPADELVLNGDPQPLTARQQRCISFFRERSSLPAHRLRIVSRNSFPTSAGMASSASGIAALCFGLRHLYGCELFSVEELALATRVGSGSACRSLFPGFVLWRTDGSVVQLPYDRGQFSGWIVLILSLSERRKAVSSSDGMALTRGTSDLFSFRVNSVVPARIEEMIGALKSGDGAAVLRLAMRDCNCMHATCLDTYPPISYLTDESRLIVAAVTEFNALAGCEKVAYTFDAGSNPFVLVPSPETLEAFKGFLREHRYCDLDRPAGSDGGMRVGVKKVFTTKISLSGPVVLS